MRSESDLQRTILRSQGPGYWVWLCSLLTCVFLIAAEAQSTKPVIILLGPPASGKSTQAALIQERYGLTLITVAQLIQDDPSQLARHKSSTPTIEPRVDPALNNLFIKRLENTEVQKGLLLDGYPSTKDHGDFLIKVLPGRGLKKPRVLKFELSDDVVRERLKGQDPELLEQNLKDYHREMDYVSSYFPQADIVRIDASQQEKAIFQQINKAIDEYLKAP
jgi:adenylate kinase